MIFTYWLHSGQPTTQCSVKASSHPPSKTLLIWNFFWTPPWKGGTQAGRPDKVPKGAYFCSWVDGPFLCQLRRWWRWYLRRGLWWDWRPGESTKQLLWNPPPRSTKWSERLVQTQSPVQNSAEELGWNRNRPRQGGRNCETSVGHIIFHENQATFLRHLRQK